MLENCLCSVLEILLHVKRRSSSGLVNTYVRDLGHPWVQGPYLPNKAFYAIYIFTQKMLLRAIYKSGTMQFLIKNTS